MFKLEWFVLKELWMMFWGYRVNFNMIYRDLLIFYGICINIDIISSD